MVKNATLVSRRHFIKTSALAAGGLTVAKQSFAQHHYSLIDNLGLQLSAVREPLMTQPQQTVEVIQRAGYRQVELFDTQLLPQLSPVFKGLGLTINSSHFLPPLITGNWNPLTALGTSPPPEDYTFERAVDQAAEYGLTYLVFPFVYPQDRGGLEFYRTLADQLNKAGEQCQLAGIQLVYRHHAFEFHPMEDTTPLTVLLERTSAGLLHLESSVFWLQVAGVSPVTFMRNHAKRIALLHLTDLKAGTPQSYLAATLPKDSFQPVGSGTLDFAEILKVAQEVEVKHCFVAQDESEKPLADVLQSAKYLKGLTN